MNANDIALEVEEIAVCSKIEPEDLIEALEKNVKPESGTSLSTRVSGAVEQIHEFAAEENLTITQIIESAKQYF
jgi:hypothetical protein